MFHLYSGVERLAGVETLILTKIYNVALSSSGLVSKSKNRTVISLITNKFQANDSFSTAYSGGRDRKVWSFDLRNPDNRSLICEEKAPVLKVSSVKWTIVNFGRNNFYVVVKTFVPELQTACI